MQKKSITFLMGLLCSVAIQGQSFDRAKVDNVFNTIESTNKAMGTITILKEGKELYQNSIGFSNISKKIKADKFTRYRIGSVTKTFTAAIILKLIEEGKLDFTTLLSTYFPEIVNAKKINIENLLYHRSGLHNVTNEAGFEIWISKPRSRKEMLAKFIKNGADFEPNERTEYSNTNYILLSYIAEDIEKQSYARLLENKIINQIGLKKTAFGGEINSDKNEAFSYYLEDNKWKPITIETNLSGTMGAGGIVSTSKDLTVFYDNLFSQKIISKSSLTKMTTLKSNMGMGVSELVFKGMKIYGHDGALDGFRSIAAYIPEKKIAIAFTLNASNTSTTGLLITILETLFSNDSTLKRDSIITLNSEDLDVYLGVYGGPTFPAKITFTKKENTLFAQATGQPIFKLIAIKKDVFKYDSMGIIFDFNISENSMTVNFGGKEHILKKENE